MISVYQSDAQTAEELKLGWFHPLFSAIPELAALQPVAGPLPERPAEIDAEDEPDRSGAHDAVVGRGTLH